MPKVFVYELIKQYNSVQLQLNSTATSIGTTHRPVSKQQSKSILPYPYQKPPLPQQL
jgi:hypothetical protein